MNGAPWQPLIFDSSKIWELRYYLPNNRLTRYYFYSIGCFNLSASKATNDCWRNNDPQGQYNKIMDTLARRLLWSKRLKRPDARCQTPLTESLPALRLLLFLFLIPYNFTSGLPVWNDRKTGIKLKQLPGEILPLELITINFILGRRPFAGEADGSITLRLTNIWNWKENF